MYEASWHSGGDEPRKNISECRRWLVKGKNGFFKISSTKLNAKSNGGVKNYFHLGENKSSSKQFLSLANICNELLSASNYIM